MSETAPSRSLETTAEPTAEALAINSLTEAANAFFSGEDVRVEEPPRESVLLEELVYSRDRQHGLVRTTFEGGSVGYSYLDAGRRVTYSWQGGSDRCVEDVPYVDGHPRPPVVHQDAEAIDAVREQMVANMTSQPHNEAPVTGVRRFRPDFNPN